MTHHTHSLSTMIRVIIRDDTDRTLMNLLTLEERRAALIAAAKKKAQDLSQQKEQRNGTG